MHGAARPKSRALVISGDTGAENMARIRLVWVNEGPQVDPILGIHRGEDGFVSFSRKTQNGEWQEFASVRSDSLATMFPEFRAELMRDSYYTVNSFYRARGPNRNWPKLGAPYRKKEGLRYLNACYADLDCYKAGLDYVKMAGVVLVAQSKGIIPRASIFAQSGRGVWLFWLLQDPNNPGKPQRAWPEKIALWKRIQKEIHDRLAVCGADAHDAVRVTRVPGSIHSGANQSVTYAWQPNARGQAVVYTLDDMAKALGLTQFAVQTGAKRRGWLALQSGRLRQFDRLRAMRGGFQEGCRNRALLLYVIFMLKNGFGENAVMDNARRFGAECRPPLSEQEIGGAVASAKKAKQYRHRVTNQTISDWLQIRPEESAGLESWKPASSFRLPVIPEEERPTRKGRMKARRDAIKEIVADGDRVPSAREMVTLLREQYSVSASHVTVEADYRALGIVSEAARKPHTLGAKLQGNYKSQNVVHDLGKFPRI